ncbi:arginase family protein [Fibrobacter sp. UWP2]|uniref:arginase family protein n=1 Tax=Fibrobacter sp. UWP2 TaxID=1896216 RepID=UPI00091C59EF|nr:arginase family protein [Fibrobacter sp. UWP2]SHI30950.1 Arginase family protein [Fibrobacter sp. UWP2]
MNLVVQDFTGVYGEQAFVQRFKDACHCEGNDFCYIDCSDVSGTDCYCDSEAEGFLVGMLAKYPPSGIHFFDSGNYHYMSKIWTGKITEPFTLVVFDHHPDMQPPRFGDILSCGSWVKEALDSNKFIHNVVLIGVADKLATEVQTDESVDFARYAERVAFITESEVCRLCQDGNALPQKVLAMVGESLPVYISIDKDVLCEKDAVTNWDQGSLDVATLKKIIAGLATSHKIIGVDICGERARDFAGDEYHTVQEADSLNDRINRELIEFLQNFLQ